MEEMALFQEAGYERLYRWGQTQTRSLTSEEIEVSPTLQRAMKALSDRAVLFRYTLDEYANARKSTTVRGFIEALTRLILELNLFFNNFKAVREIKLNRDQSSCTRTILFDTSATWQPGFINALQPSGRT